MLPWRDALRIFLLDLTEPVDAGSHVRSGFVLVGGRTIIEHQLDIALDFGCERVICMVRALDPPILALQHRVERADRSFHTVSAPRELSALVTANDEVVLFAEGLLADHQRALQVLESGSGVFVQPVESGLAAGFERLDINNASAGIVRVPGRLIERLVQLPTDCDVTSALMRLALQDGMSMREVPAEARGGLHWLMIRNESDAFAIEHDWLEQKLGRSTPLSPGRWLARQGLLMFGPSLLHAGNASAIMAAAMMATLALALGVAWLGSPAGGFVGCALAWIFYRVAILLRRIEGPRAREDGPGAGVVCALGWIFDVELVVLSVWSEHPQPDVNLMSRIFAPSIFMLLIRLLTQLRSMPGPGWLSDRSILSIVLAICAALGVLNWLVSLGAVALAAMAIALTRPGRS